jgi:1,4-alpha-glucan branching enzyme
MGSHPVIHNGISKSYFSVWAPYARSVSVIGDFNAWNGARHQLAKRSDESGIWEGTYPNIKEGNRYKFSINNSVGATIDKADPFATYSEISPATASVVHPLKKISVEGPGVA